MNGVLQYRSKEWYQERLKKLESNHKITPPKIQEKKVKEPTIKQNKEKTPVEKYKESIKPTPVYNSSLYNFPKPYDWKKEWKLYRNEVRRITQEQDLQSLEHYDKRITHLSFKEHGFNVFRSESYYALDHKTSIWYGWKNGIPAETIGHISNLRYIPSLQNLTKGIKCE
jgi:hypothetical protein